MTTGSRSASPRVTGCSPAGWCWPSATWPQTTQPLESGRLADEPAYLHDAWDTEAVRAIPSEADVLLVGTGLTMVDWAFSLARLGHRGRIHAVSRHGLLPRSHGPAAAIELGPGIGAAPATALGLSQAVRAEVERVVAGGGDWRSVVDALRPRTQALWAGLPTDERRRFMRHLRPYWDVHRHRAAPHVAAQVEELRRSGQLNWSPAGSSGSSRPPRAWSSRSAGADRARSWTCRSPGSSTRSGRAATSGGAASRWSRTCWRAAWPRPIRSGSAFARPPTAACSIGWTGHPTGCSRSDRPDGATSGSRPRCPSCGSRPPGWPSACSGKRMWARATLPAHGEDREE